MNCELRDAILGTVAGMRGEKKAAEAAYIEGFRKAAEIAGADPEELYKQAQVKLLAGAERAARVRSLLSAGKVVLPRARSTKQLITEVIGNTRGARARGWPLPTYSGRLGRDSGLLDVLDRARFLGSAKSKAGGRLSTEEVVNLLRRLNGSSDISGPELAKALRASVAKPAPVGLDLTTLVGGKAK